MDWRCHCLSGRLPLLILEVATAYLGGCHCLSGGGGKMNLRIRLTSAKVGVEAELATRLPQPQLMLKLS